MAALLIIGICIAVVSGVLSAVWYLVRALRETTDECTVILRDYKLTGANLEIGKSGEMIITATGTASKVEAAP